MTRTAGRSTPPDGPEPRIEGDPTDEDIAAVDDASTDPTLAAAGHGAPTPAAVIKRIAMVGLGVGVAVLLFYEATEALRSLRRRTSHRLAERWAGIERRARGEARRAVFGEVAALAARITRRPD
jgi:hypothetical protein